MEGREHSRERNDCLELSPLPLAHNLGQKVELAGIREFTGQQEADDSRKDPHFNTLFFVERSPEEKNHMQ